MEIIKGTPAPTTRMIGRCEPCAIPVVIANEGTTPTVSAQCPLCHAWVQVERIYGQLNTAQCDPRCEGATGPVCSCGCGGANHGGAWSRFETVTAGQLDAYRAEYARRLASAKKAGATRTANVKAAKVTRAQAAWEAFRAEWPDLAAWADNMTPDARFELDGFRDDMYAKMDARQPLSYNMAVALERSLKRDAERAARRAEIEAAKALAGPVPTGTITVTGVVVATKLQEGDWGDTPKMLVKGQGGWTVWSTIPREIDDVNATTPGNLGGLRGRTVEFTATVKAKPDDPTFGYASRPRKARIVEPATV